jgi:anti-sigma factor RsiW
MMSDPRSTPSPCPIVRDSDLDVRYVAGLLSAEEAEAFEAHFFSCDECFSAVQLGSELRAAMRAGHGAGDSIAAPMRVGADRARIAPRWRPLLVAAAVLIVAVGLWGIGSLRLRRADGVRTSGLAYRGEQGSFIVTSRKTAHDVISSWAPRPLARSYRVRLLTRDGTLVVERETTDTSIGLPIDSLPALRRGVPVYWQVQALDALREVVGTSSPVPAVVRSTLP